MTVTAKLFKSGRSQAVRLPKEFRFEGDRVRIRRQLRQRRPCHRLQQQQARGRTVEAELKRALRELTGKDHVVYGAGRTDAGAHAEGQVANFEFEGRIPTDRLAAALNARLPEDVAVLSAAAVPDGFHARFSARWRRYRYRYLDRAARPALGRGRCWHVRGKLDVRAMSRAAEALRGKLAAFYAQRTITRRPILPEDCARAICWLAGEQSAKTTGHVIPVDGGLAEAFLR